MIIELAKHVEETTEEERKQAEERVELAQKDCVVALEAMLKRAKAGEFAAVNICAVMGAWVSTPRGQKPERAMFLPVGTDGVDAGLCGEPFFTPLLGAINYSSESIIDALRQNEYEIL